MATQQKTTREVESCRHLLQGQAKNLADRLYGPAGPPPGTSFSHLEALALQLTASLRTQLLNLLLARQAEALHRALPADLRLCPSCGRETIPQDPEPHQLHARAGIPGVARAPPLLPQVPQSVLPAVQKSGPGSGSL